NLAQLRAARFKDIRDAKTTADLHQFPARDDDLLSVFGGEMTQGEDQRRCAIVDHRCGLRAAEQREIVFEISSASPTLSAAEVVFEIVVIGGNTLEGFNHRGPEGRPAQVRMDDDTGAVNDPLNA